MDGENTNGGQEATQGGTQEQEVQGQQQEPQGSQEVGGGNAGTDWEAQIAQRDQRIAELEGQVAEAAKNAEAADKLRGEISEVKAQAESDRLDFKLQLAGVRNVKAARALLGDYGNDVGKLKEAEPWLFEGEGKHSKGGNAGGATGLPNAGAATDAGKQLRHWREVAGLTDDDSKKKE
ncbi:MAG: hypothetical protein J6D54_13830 [Olsenella sp.]|nr:hypothetical protein [Olsenella sp.]